MLKNYYLFLLTVLCLTIGCKDEELLLIDDRGLLTDAGLETRSDPNAPDESESFTDWIQVNHQAIRSIVADDFSDLTFLAPLVAGKRVVQLGESGHGVREFNQMKVRLIKYLHQEVGYNVIAFESGLFECFRTDQEVMTNAREAMDNSIFAVWSTSEVLELFEYIISTKDTSNPLILTGFDVQFSSFSGTFRKSFLQTILQTVDVEYSTQAFNLEAEVRNLQETGQIYEMDESKKDDLIAEYEELQTFIITNRTALESTQDPSDVKVALQIAKYVPFFLEQSHAWGMEDYTASTEYRDEGMAMNVEFLMDELYPNQKIMIWAHNFHIRYGNLEVTPSERAVQTMGGYLEERRDEMYTIGLFMYRGRAAQNNRVVYDIGRAETGSLESIFYRTRRRYTFLDLLDQTEVPGNRWIFSAIPMKDWGVNDLVMVPRDNYDGILFIDTVTPPNYL